MNDRGAEEAKRRGGGRNKARFEHLPEVVTLVNPPEEERAGLIWISEELTVSGRPSTGLQLNGEAQLS